MRKEITVAAQPRESRGKNEARRTRSRGLIPAVVYGAFKDPVPVAVSPKAILQIVHSEGGYNTIFNLDIEGRENTPVMVVDYQNDPIRGTLLRVSIPIGTLGEPKGVKTQGGLLEIITRAAEIECLPDEIPEHFTVDVTELLMGQSKRFSDLPLSGSMKLIGPPDTVVAHIVAMRAEEVKPVAEAAPTAEAAAPTAAEPEVIKKGKKEEAAEEAKPKKK